MGFLSLLSGKAWAGLGAACAFAIFIGWGAMALVDSTRATCEGRHALASQQATEAAHTKYLAALEWGNQISKQLAEKQRALNETEKQYLTYANAITGVCDPSFRVFVEYASGAKDRMPETSGTPADSPASKAPADPSGEQVSRALAANIAANYARLDHCVAGFNALIDWHETVK